MGAGQDVGRYIGDSYNDGAWHCIEVDLEAFAQEAFGLTTHVVAIDGIMTQGNNIYLDDFTFASGALRRTYQVVPGAAVGGVLGGAAGPNVADAGVRRYYHYNDLGTVLVQTRLDAAGTFSIEGAWEPDFFGNYEGRAAYPGSPTRPELGLTGQFFDTATGTYHFRYRDLDPERGRWLSEEPSAIDGLNLYHFDFGNTINLVDVDGRNALTMERLIEIGGGVTLSDGPEPGPLDVVAVVVLAVGAVAVIVTAPDPPPSPQPTDSAGNPIVPVPCPAPTAPSESRAHGKGERNKAAKPSGTDNEFKHMRPDPNDSTKVRFKDPHTGKWITKPKPPGFPEPTPTPAPQPRPQRPETGGETK